VASTSRRRTLGSALVLSTVMMGIPISTASAAAEPLEYVALGDSSVSGTGVPIQEDLVCTRSTQAWPKVVAAELGAELTDVSGGGAKVDDFSGRQFGFVAPQYDALTADTDLVTLTIGGNDISLVQTALNCINLFPEPADRARGSATPRRRRAGRLRHGSRCRRRLTCHCAYPGNLSTNSQTSRYGNSSTNSRRNVGLRRRNAQVGRRKVQLGHGNDQVVCVSRSARYDACLGERVSACCSS
jgi:lysophospholipase L1-like esterase